MNTYLRHRQVQELTDEKHELEAMLVNPLIQEKGMAKAVLNRVSSMLTQQAPPEVRPDEVDSLVKREKELRDDMQHGMPSHEEMRKVPTGAVGKHQAWEARNKPKLMEWKNIRLRLNIGNPDPDISNFEMYRPDVSRLEMRGAEIPGQSWSHPSEAFKENYDEAFEKVQNDMGILMTEIRELKQQLADQVAAPVTEDKPKRTLTPEHKAAMAAGRASARQDRINRGNE